MILENAPPAPGAPGEMVPASAAQSLPSTRAGGQDDGSNKLPQKMSYGQKSILAKPGLKLGGSSFPKPLFLFEGVG